MTAQPGTFDSDLQMIVEVERDLDPYYLEFLRYLVDHKRMDCPVEDDPEVST